MQENKLNTQLLFRIAGWMWLVYLLAQFLLDAYLYHGRISPMTQIYHLSHLFPALIFLFFSYLLNERNKKTFGFLLIALISLSPILINQMLNLRFPPAPLTNIEGMAIRQLPVLLLGLLLVAWQYDLKEMIAYTFIIHAIDLSLLLLLKSSSDPQYQAFLAVLLIRMISFFIVGFFINRLIHSLRSQQHALQQANEQLNHYASTLETLTITRERNRMSRELHDTAVHTLSGLAVQLETASAYMDVEPQTSKHLVDQSLQTVRHGLDETRRALKALRASPLEDLGLLLALQTLLENTAQRGKLTLHSRLPEMLNLAPDIEQTLYRITQEALENVLHHANAQNLTVALTLENDDLNLIIEDDGIGFDTGKAAPSGHYGLTGMQERAEMIGGSLIIGTHPGQGCKIHFQLSGAEQ